MLFRSAFYEHNLGKTFRVLFENDVENGKIHGFTENYVRVWAQYDPLLINEIKHVRLTSIEANGPVAVEEAESEFSHH